MVNSLHRATLDTVAVPDNPAMRRSAWFGNFCTRPVSFLFMPKNSAPYISVGSSTAFTTASLMCIGIVLFLRKGCRITTSLRPLSSLSATIIDRFRSSPDIRTSQQWVYFPIYRPSIRFELHVPRLHPHFLSASSRIFGCRQHSIKFRSSSSLRGVGGH